MKMENRIIVDENQKLEWFLFEFEQDSIDMKVMVTDFIICDGEEGFELQYVTVPEGAEISEENYFKIIEKVLQLYVEHFPANQKGSTWKTKLISAIGLLKSYTGYSTLKNTLTRLFRS